MSEAYSSEAEVDFYFGSQKMARLKCVIVSLRLQRGCITSRGQFECVGDARRGLHFSLHCPCDFMTVNSSFNLVLSRDILR
jgi:hypothetical protein